MVLPTDFLATALHRAKSTIGGVGCIEVIVLPTTDEKDFEIVYDHLIGGGIMCRRIILDRPNGVTFSVVCGKDKMSIDHEITRIKKISKQNGLQVRILRNPK